MAIGGALKRLMRYTPHLCLCAVILGILCLALSLGLRSAADRESSAENLLPPWRKYSHREAVAIAEAGDPVVVCVFADWAITVAWYRYFFQEPEVQQFIHSERIVPMLWDMTDEAPENFELLDLFDSKVPGVLWYPAGEGHPISLDAKINS